MNEAGTAAPSRSQANAKRSQVARRRVVAGVIVAVIVVGLGAYLLTRDGGGIIDDIIPGGPETPTLAFDKVKIVAVPTTGTKATDIDVAGDGEAVQALVTDFYQQAWIDPDVWEGGDYAGVFDEVMTGDAIEAAQTELEALTLGPDAGATYALIAPTRSTITIEALTDAKDHAAQMMAQVVFTASAEHTDGTYTDIEQTATYFIANVDGDWRIISFDAKRAEEAGEAPASDTPSAEAS